MQRILKQHAYRCGFHNLSGVNYNHPVTKIRHYSKSWVIIMVLMLLFCRISFISLSICACMVTSQRGCRLVGYKQLGAARKRHRNHYSLPHASRQLMRILFHPLTCVGYSAKLPACKAFSSALFRSSSVQQNRLATCLPQVCMGLSEVIGS